MDPIRKLALGLTLLLACASGYANDSLTALTHELKQTTPDWFPAVSVCPADVIPAREVDVNYLGERCVGMPERCLKRCQFEDANACYALALAIQTVDDGPLADALFLRACTLGVVSGCTNRAAGMLDDDLRCSIRTFEQTCELRDPWGCTMLGLYLSIGEGIEKDTERALRVMQGSCRYGEADEACQYARSLRERITSGDL